MITWGSVDHHALTIAQVNRVDRRKRCRYCPARNPVTHRGLAGGVCMMAGCEWHVRLWHRDNVLRQKRGASVKVNL